MAKELHMTSLTRQPEEPDGSERTTHPVIEIKKLEGYEAKSPRAQETEAFSMEHLNAFEDRASVLSRVISRALDSHRAGASAVDLGKELRGAQLKKLHGNDLAASRTMIQIANALEACSKLTQDAAQDTEAMDKLYLSLENVADLSPKAFENFSQMFHEKMGPVIQNMKQRKREIAEAAHRPSTDLAALIEETEAMETELLEINTDLPVASKFQAELAAFQNEVRSLRDATLQEIQRRQLKEAA